MSLSSIASSTLLGWKNHRQAGVVSTLASALLAIAGSYLAASLSFRRKKALLPTGTQRPPHAWSFIPYLGCALQLGAGINEFIRTKSKALQDAPLFTATILGDKCVFFRDPRLLNTVFKPSLQKYLDDVSLQKTFASRVLDFTETDINENYDATVKKTGERQYHHHLFQRDSLETSIAKVQTVFAQVFPSFVTSSTTTANEWTQHNLFDLVVSTIYKASVGPLLSPHVATDQALQDFREFDQGTIPLFNGAPSFAMKPAIQARTRLLELLSAPQFLEQASGLMKDRSKELKVQPSGLDKSNLGLLWASVGNSAPAVFWVLLRLLHNEQGWNACYEQVQSVIAKRNQRDSHKTIFTLQDLDEMTLLESAFYEALRMYQGNFTARRVVEDFVLETSHGKYLIEKGSKLMPFWGILHTDPHVFDHPEEFQYDRFVNASQRTFTFENGDRLTHFPLVAFGGGSHLCPGRKFINYEVRLFLAMLMENVEMKLVVNEDDPKSKNVLPSVDPAMQGIGVSHPNKAVYVQVRAL